MAPEQSWKQGNIKHASIRGVIKELAGEVDEKSRESLQKLWAKVENEELQVEGIIKETITRMRADEDAPEWIEKLLRKLHLVSEDTNQAVSMEDRGLKGGDSLYEKEQSDNRLERFKVKTINVGVVKEGEDHK